MNAANYQYFAQTVTDGATDGACSDRDGNCPYYTSYCNTDRVKAECKKTCGLCGSGSGDGACSDRDGNCPYYTSYCNTERVKAECKKTCGLCGSGSGGGGGDGSSQPCADTYGHCQWYKEANYCGTASVLAQCRR